MCSWAQPGCLDDLVQECACQAECCSGPAAPAGVPPPCETLSHVFVTCPVVSPAVGWLRELWRRIGGSLPPLDARVLVVGDRSVWEPEGGRYGWELWSHLRLLFCRSVWSLTSKKSSKALPARQLPRDMHSQPRVPGPLLNMGQDTIHKPAGSNLSRANNQPRMIRPDIHRPAARKRRPYPSTLPIQTHRLLHSNQRQS